MLRQEFFSSAFYSQDTSKIFLIIVDRKGCTSLRFPWRCKFALFQEKAGVSLSKQLFSVMLLGRRKSQTLVPTGLLLQWCSHCVAHFRRSKWRHARTDKMAIFHIFIKSSSTITMSKTRSLYYYSFRDLPYSKQLNKHNTTVMWLFIEVPILQTLQSKG